MSHTIIQMIQNILQALNMAPPKTTDYAALLRKLKEDLVKSTPSPNEKKPKIKEWYYPTNSQL